MRISRQVPTTLRARTSSAFRVGGCLVIPGAAVWQRLTFERWLDVPPPWLALFAWLVAFGFFTAHLLSADAARRGAAIIGSTASLLELAALGWPSWQPPTELEAYRFALARHLSTTWHGLPVPALVSMMGVLACAFLCTQSLQRRAIGAGAAAILVLFGATTVLGYATGSPWPFGS